MYKTAYNLVGQLLKDAEITNINIANVTSNDAAVHEINGALLKFADKVAGSKFSFVFDVIDATYGNDNITQSLDDIVYGSAVINYSIKALKNAEDNLAAAKASGDVNKIDSAYSEYANCFAMAKELARALRNE